MATSFPGSADSFTNPSSGSSLSSPSHADQHANVNDAVEAIELALLDGAPLFIDDTNERVGIGTTSPSELLDVNGQAIVGGGDDRTPDSTGDGHLMLDGNGYTGFLSLDADGMWVGHNSNSRNLILATNETSAVQINPSGVVGVGTTTPGTQPGSNGRLYVESTSIPCNFYYNGTNTAYSGWKVYSDVTGSQTLQALVRSTGDFESRTNSYGATSDVAIKQDIVDAPSQWDDIKAVQLRKYRLIDDVTENGDNAVTQLGVIAQELEASGMGGLVVDADPDNDKQYKTVKYSVLELKALGALQEAMERIELLEARIAALQEALTTINDLTARIEALEAG